ncbi:hypothetical protein AC249_AIPGENE2568, partial [Exaiptasia diaphana]
KLDTAGMQSQVTPETPENQASMSQNAASTSSDQASTSSSQESSQIGNQINN